MPRLLPGKLLSVRFVEEIAAKPDMPVWRTNDEDQPLALRITVARLKAIGVTDEAPSSIGAVVLTVFG